MKKHLLILALALAGCGQNPPTKTEPPKTAPAMSEPAKSEPVSTSAPASAPDAAPQRDMLSAVTANGVEEAQGMGDPEKAKAPSSKTFKNAKLLGDVSGGRFMASMQSMSASVGGDCGFCHKDDFSSDANGHKVITRKMIEMSFAINRDHFENKVEVSCFTCHRGEKEPKVSATKEKPKKEEMSAADQKKPSGEFYKNVTALNSLPAGELRTLMKSFNDSLGVSCEFCHVKGEFESDEKPEKKTAREMIQMSMALNATYFPKKKTPPITCDTCHHGAKEPAINVGPKVVVAATVKDQPAWTAVFGVAKWPTTPKTRGDLQAALKPIPVNQAISGMLLHTDTGELGHLPPGEYSVCGFSLPAKQEDDKSKDERAVTCQPLTIQASPEIQTVKIELPAP